jgi:DNA-binding beta-propeller fold protein YncE
MMNYKILSFVLLLFVVSCTSQKKKTGEAASGVETVRKYELVEAWKTDTLFRVPESVIYDENNDVLYVSNMNYEARLKDGNGFISRLSTSGEILDLKWVEDMSSPKGLDEVIVIDIAKGEIADRIVIEGAKMINDISIDSRGNVYVSDSDNNSIWVISGGVVSNWLSEGMDKPNGLLVDGDRLMLDIMNAEEFASIDMATKQISIISEGVGAADGIARVDTKGHFQETGAADLDYIPEKNLVLVPTFYKQTVVAYKLIEKED